MKLEADYKTELVKEAKRRGYFARRVEDRFGVGFPDMVIRVPHLPPAFVEAKRIEKGRTIFGPSDRQLIDLEALNEPPMSFGIVLGIDPWYLMDGTITYHFSPPKKVVEINSPTLFHSTDFFLGLIKYMKVATQDAQRT